MTARLRGRVGAAMMVLAAAGANAQDGRWEGRAEVPGASVMVLLDIAAGRATLTLPGRGVRALPLPAYQWRDGVLQASAGDGDAIAIELRVADVRASGLFRQGGHAAPLSLQRAGDAPPATLAADPLAASLHGTWRGRYDIGFGPREATLRLGASTASLTVVGRRTVDIPFDEVGQRGALLMLRARDADLAIEAPAAGAARGVLAATLRQGPFESRLELVREVAP